MVKDRIIVSVGSRDIGGKTEKTFKLQGDVDTDGNEQRSWILDSMGQEAAEVIKTHLADFQRGGKYAAGLTEKEFKSNIKSLVGKLQYHTKGKAQRTAAAEFIKSINMGSKVGQSYDVDKNKDRYDAAKNRVTFAKEQLKDGSKTKKEKDELNEIIKRDSATVRRLAQFQKKGKGFQPQAKTSVRLGFDGKGHLIGTQARRRTANDMRHEEALNRKYGMNPKFVAKKENQRNFAGTREELVRMMELKKMVSKIDKMGGFFDPSNPDTKKQEKAINDPNYKKAVSDFTREFSKFEQDMDPTNAPQNVLTSSIEDSWKARQRYSALQGAIKAAATPQAAAPKAAAPKAATPKAAAPKAAAPKAAAPKAAAPKAETPKAEAPKAEAPKAEAPKAAAPKAEAKKPSKEEIRAKAMEVAKDRGEEYRREIFDKTDPKSFKDSINKFLVDAVGENREAMDMMSDFIGRHKAVGAELKERNILPVPTPEMGEEETKKLEALHELVVQTHSRDAKEAKAAKASLKKEGYDPDTVVVQVPAAQSFNGRENPELASMRKLFEQATLVKSKNTIDQIKGAHAKLQLGMLGYASQNAKFETPRAGLSRVANQELEKKQALENQMFVPLPALDKYINNVYANVDDNRVRNQLMPGLRDIAAKIIRIKATDTEGFDKLQASSSKIPAVTGLFDFARKLNQAAKDYRQGKYKTDTQSSEAAPEVAPEPTVASSSKKNTKKTTANKSTKKTTKKTTKKSPKKA